MEAAFVTQKPVAEVVHQAWSCPGGLPRGGSNQLISEEQVYRVKTDDDIPGRIQMQRQGCMNSAERGTVQWSRGAEGGKGAGRRGERELEHLKA